MSPEVRPNPGTPPGSLRRVAKNSVVVFMARTADVGAGLITIPLLTRYLGPDLYGSYSWILALVFPFQTLVNFELNTILTREIARRPDRAERLMGAALWIKWTLMVLFAIAMGGIATAARLPQPVVWALAVAVAGEIAYQHALLWNGLFHAHQRMEIETLLNILARAIGLGGQILAVVLDLGFVAVFVPLALASAVRAALGALAAARWFVLPRIRGARSEVKNLIREAGIMTTASTLMALAMRISVYLLEHLRGSTEVALYNVPFNLVLQLQILPTAVVIALFPVFSQWNESSREKLARTASVVAGFMLLAGGALAALGTPLARPVVLLLAGARFEAAAGSLRILLWCIPLLFLNFLLSYLLISLKQQRKLITGAVATILLNGGLGWFMIDRWGHRGASLASLAGYGVQTLIIMYYLKKALPSLDFIGTMMKPAGICLVAWAAGLLALRFGPVAGAAGAATVLLPGVWVSGILKAEELRRLRHGLRRRREEDGP